ncbi:MAG: FtsQ-type POTRA domain-containing protein [Treponema sp.]|jgi:cell division protein FtsQ|nr:FtsQ-type POTRA domain-containing protein [Treponema sp.]
MSNEYIFTEEALPAGVPVSSKMDRRLKAGIVVLAIILGAELIWLLGVSPWMPLSVVEVEGIPELDKAMVLAQAGIDGRSSFMSVNAGASEYALESLHQIGSARITKRFPDTVSISLEPRKAVAFSLAAVGGKISPVFFDKQGVVFKIGKGDSEKEAIPPSLPIISGLIFEQAVLGMRLPAMFSTLLADLERINSTAPELLRAVSEIQINRKIYGGFELILYPVYYPVKVRLGRELKEDTLRYMLLLIDVFNAQGLDVEELDFRTGTASYTIKEASLG